MGPGPRPALSRRRLRGGPQSKVEAGRPLRDLGFVMRAFALPGEGRFVSMYGGPAPKGTDKLPRRKVERTGAGRRSAATLKLATPNHLAVLVAALEAAPQSDERDELLVLLPAAAA